MIRVSALPLFACKIGPDLFDLCAGMHNVSIRDQMHRAALLSSSLIEGRQLHPGEQVLIVGAGVAGITAGIMLARHGIRVQIIESEDSPFALQRGISSRFVGPYIYEWPSEVHRSQEMPPASDSPLAPWTTDAEPLPLSFPDPAPLSPSALAKHWDGELVAAIAKHEGRLRVQAGVERDATNRNLKNWCAARSGAPGFSWQGTTLDIVGGQPWGESEAPHADFLPRFVLLAAGFGTERNSITCQGDSPLEGARFWAEDAILEKNCGRSCPPKIVIIGGGDGALQDTLRAATAHAHPLQTWNKLKEADKDKVLVPAERTIQAMEIQQAFIATWACDDSRRKEVQKVIDDAYRDLAIDLASNESLAHAARDMLRKDVESVRLCVRESHFTKAYALNRLLVHLFEQCAAVAGSSDKVRLSVLRGVGLERAENAGSTKVLTFSGGHRLDADLWIVRAGVDATGLLGQWLGLEQRDTINRGELAAIPLPLYFSA